MKSFKSTDAKIENPRFSPNKSPDVNDRIFVLQDYPQWMRLIRDECTKFIPFIYL